MKSSNPKVKVFSQNFNFLKTIYSMNEQIRLSAIRNDKIFEMVLYDIKAPKHLKSYFSEFCPIFKNVELERNDISDLMEKFAWLTLWWEKKKMSQFLPATLNPNHEQFSLECVDHQAYRKNTEQILMELDGFTFAFHSCSSNYLLIIFFELEDVQ